MKTLAKTTDRQFPSIPSFIDQFFRGDLMDWTNSNFAEYNSTMPAVNVRENDDEYQIELAAPGMKKDDFNLNYENGRLFISSEKKDERKEGDDEQFTRREFYYQSFQRSFAIPENVVDADKIKAKYEDGILHINLPKREEAKPKPAKTIKIS